MSEWKKVKLGEVANIFSGYAFKSHDMNNICGIPLIKIKNIANFIVSTNCDSYLNKNVDIKKWEKYKLQADDFLIAMTGQGSVGRVGKMISFSPLYYVNQRVAIVRPNTSIINPYFLYKCFATKERENELFNKANGAGQPNISPSQIGEIEFSIPTINSQNNIATLLYRYDSLIENYQKQIKLLEEAAQRLYKEWFVDLHFPGHENTKIVDGVPEGWEKKRLIDLVDVQYGYAFDGQLFNSNGEGMPILRIRNIPDGTTSDYTTEETSESFIVHNGDIVVGMDGIFHINSWSGGDAYLVQRACSFRPKEECTRGFIFQAIQEPIKFFEKTLVGATVAHLGKKHIDSIELIVPSNKDLYVPFQTGFKQRQSLLSQIRLLTEARDRLLPKLMSSEIAV